MSRRVSAIAIAAPGDERLPLGVCWLIWSAVSLTLWSLVAGFVA